MTVPICPTHGTPMREGRGGGFFCPKKTNGEWCKAKAPTPVSIPTVITNNPSMKTYTNGSDYRLEALKGACQVYEGTGSADAMDFARAALVFLKGEA